jgi:hypothetical protein
MELPSHEALVARSQWARRQLRAFATQHTDGEVLWCQLPRLLSATNRVLEPHRVPAPLRASQRRALRASGRKRKMAGGVGAEVGGSGPARCLFLADGSQRRAQAPLRERFGPVASCEGDIRLPVWRTRRLLRQADDLAGDLIAFAASNQVELPIDSASLYRGMLRTARLLEGWRRLLPIERPAVVVVGSVWQPPARALLCAAREAGVPSVFVPHTPQRSEAHPIDLAVDYVGLRGPGEVDFLAAQGIARDRLDVVGTPLTVDDEPPEIDFSAPVVFAPSSEDRQVLEPMIELVHSTVGSRVVVGRHPAARPEGASAFPREWPIFPQRTLHLLQRGAPVVLQQSSAIALEAMHLGIPVIELHFPGQTPTFPLVSEPHVRFASTSGQLEAALACCSAAARDAERRVALVQWARHWASPTGAPAADRLVALVETAIGKGAGEPIWDSARRLARAPGGGP